LCRRTPVFGKDRARTPTAPAFRTISVGCTLWFVDIGGGLGSGPVRGNPEFTSRAVREAGVECEVQSYSVSFRSALVGVLVFVAILVGVYLIFT
jgi:hypothetical protein